MHSNVYGSRHEGVGFANYVVGNAVAKFWKSHVKALPSDPFAGALGVQKKGTIMDDAKAAANVGSSKHKAAKAKRAQAILASSDSS
mmetsp:Transcript_27510/g.72665  ORF Transcript_27510/g.72665 Transcript_27510/m.72665 type:complete len:86 (+) Transcript_27510:311-568(+)